MGRTTTIILLCVGAVADGGRSWAADPAAAVAAIAAKCLACHSTAEQEGDIDLERLSHPERLGGAADAAAWEEVLAQVSLGAMPPEDAPQLAPAERTAVTTWIRGMLDEIALSQAGDPGPVVLRRLSNHEYTYTIRDLTGLDALDPAREFPVDGAAGEGFTNAGAALVMSPALFTKYLDAAKDVAALAVFTPRGMRWSTSSSPQDWANETLAEIQALYARHTTAGVASEVVAQGVKLDAGTGAGRVPLDRYLDALQGRGGAEGLSPKYLEILRTALTGTEPSLLLDPLRARFRERTLTAADVEPWQKVLWRFTTVGHIGKKDGPRSWQEPVTPLESRHEMRVSLPGDRGVTLFLATGDAGDGADHDDVIWENPRLVAAGRPDIPVAGLPTVVERLAAQRARIIAGTDRCLAAIAAGTDDADPALLAAWRDSLGSDPDLPGPIAAWRRNPSPELAAEVRRHLEQDFPLNSPLLTPFLADALRDVPAADLRARAPSVLEVDIPEELAAGAEFVVAGRLAGPAGGSVQMQVLMQRPEAPMGLVAGAAESADRDGSWSDNRLVTRHSAPVIVTEGSEAARRFEEAFAEFRELFPIAACYARIVPVDEVVTLTLYHREDDHLRRLLLADEEIRELDRLWEELLFVSEAPAKQVAVFEQLWQFATQDAEPSAFEPLRQPILEAAARFEEQRQAAVPVHKAAVIAFAERAWRRPLTEAERAGLEAFDPRLMLVRVLTSPAFLYRGEKPGPQTGPVNDWELATRLSYFLWSSLPDDELRNAAASGSLRDPDVLAAQARRMLRDGRVRRLATEFGCHYLHVHDVATLDEKSERHFPTFVGLRGSMQEEVTRFFTDLFQEDGGVLSLIDADHSFLDDPLADHYGIPFTGPGWRRVDGMRGHGRGGVLGFAATLAKHSGASRTSAILRGTWVSEVLLGDRIPNPPKGVPVLPDEPPEDLSERQLIERHSSDARCAACHRRIDPYGFALEGFDAIGRRRDADTQAVLHDGTPVDGLEGLRDYLGRVRQADVLRQFSRKLLGYALGRSVQLSDQPLLDAMVAVDGHRVGDLIERIVRSRQFREIRGLEP